jgi:hypothetical protein
VETVAIRCFSAHWQEWEVIKVNKRGRRQWRVMGIDFTRITNKKVEKKRFGSNETFRVCIGTHCALIVACAASALLCL